MIARLKRSIDHDRPVLGGLVIVLTLLLLPTLLTTFYPRINATQGESFWMGAGIILLPAVLGVTVRRALMLWVPFAALIPAALLYALLAQSALREWAIVAAIEAPRHELERFRTAVILAVVLAVPTVWGLRLLVRKLIPEGHTLSAASRGCALILTLTTPAGNFLRSGVDVGWQLFQQRLSATSPLGPVVSMIAALKVKSDLNARTAAMPPPPVTPSPLRDREIHVLVIGESARYASFQINGYERETTPLLKQTEGLLSFTSAIAPATVTLMSVPVLLTPARAHRVTRATREPSVISVFRAAGYHTVWLSTQRHHGRFDTACSVFSVDAHESKFLSGELAAGSGVYTTALDGELLAPLRAAVERGDPKLLIVVHTMGSHQNYGDRYPPEFNVFPSQPAAVEPDHIDGSYSEAQITNLTNAYDNSIRYTDWVLHQVIETLRATHAVSSLIYLSDHGQNTGRSPVLPFAHGSMTPDVLHVPMLVWLSPEYRSARADHTRAIESHTHTALSTDTTFHTLIDMAGLDTPLLDRHRSIASDQFQTEPRVLRNLNGVVVDYDAWQSRP